MVCVCPVIIGTATCVEGKGGHHWNTGKHVAKLYHRTDRFAIEWAICWLIFRRILPAGGLRGEKLYPNIVCASLNARKNSSRCLRKVLSILYLPKTVERGVQLEQSTAGCAFPFAGRKVCNSNRCVLVINLRRFTYRPETRHRFVHSPP